jgi:hypothetical protein
MSAALGHDFGRVRVHTDRVAADSARAVNARAYTVGSSIVFGEGMYGHGGTAADALLAHELVHVVQQSGATPTSRIEVEAAASHSEHDADAVARAIVHGGAVHPLPGSPISLARADAGQPEKSWWQRTKESVYTGITDYLDTTIRESIRIERQYATTVSPRWRSTVETLIDIHEEAANIGKSLILAIVSLVGGFLTGIGQLVMGLVRIVIGLGELILAFIQDAIIGGNRTERWITDFVNTLKALPGALVKLVTDWLEEFKHSNADHQTIMIGELFGQILALIASFGVAPSRAGTAAELGGGGARIGTAAVIGEQGAKVLPFVRPAAGAAATGAEVATPTLRIVGNLAIREATETAPVAGTVPAAVPAAVPVLPAVPAPVIPIRPIPVPAPIPLIPAPLRIGIVGAGQAQNIYQQGKKPEETPEPIPIPKPQPKPKDPKHEKCERLYPRAIPIQWPTPQWFPACDPGSTDAEFDYPHRALLIKRGSTLYEPNRPENRRYRTRIGNPPFNCPVGVGEFTHHKWPLYLGGPGNLERAEGDYDPVTGAVRGGAHPNLVQLGVVQHGIWHQVLEQQPLGPMVGQGPQQATPDGSEFCVMDVV